MAVIKTQLNAVYALEPEEGDCFVQTLIGGQAGRYLLNTAHIDQYQAAVAWATGFADQMASGVVVMPITADEFVKANRERLERGLACMSDQERGELRQVAIASMLEVMRDSDDPAQRAEAYQVLKHMKVTK